MYGLEFLYLGPVEAAVFYPGMALAEGGGERHGIATMDQGGERAQQRVRRDLSLLPALKPKTVNVGVVVYGVDTPFRYGQTAKMRP